MDNYAPASQDEEKRFIRNEYEILRIKLFLAVESVQRTKILRKGKRKVKKNGFCRGSNPRPLGSDKIWHFFGPETLRVSYPPNLLKMANHLCDFLSKYRVPAWRLRVSFELRFRNPKSQHVVLVTIVALLRMCIFITVTLV